jgi:hypothetical protein
MAWAVCARYNPLAQRELAEEESFQTGGEKPMSDVVYVSKSRIERKTGPLRVAYVAGEPQPVIFSVHGAIAEHYKVDPATLTESHASTLDYVIASTAG